MRAVGWEECVQMSLNAVAWRGIVPGLRERWLAPYHGDWTAEHTARSALAQAEVLAAALRAAGRDFRAARVLEVGTGGNLCLAACLFALGAAEVVSTDRARLYRANARARAAYESLSELLRGSWPQVDAARDALIRLSSGDSDPEAIRYLPGVDIQTPPGHLRGFDLVVSYAVLEHVRSPEEAALGIQATLRPGGATAHWIDLADHLWPGDPLRFLCYSEPTFEAMTRWRSTYCNRRRVSAHLAGLEAAGLRVTYQSVTRTADPAYLAALAPRLAPDYSGLDPTDLSTLAFTVVAERPAGGGTG